jgi:hypothetical protein
MRKQTEFPILPTKVKHMISISMVMLFVLFAGTRTTFALDDKDLTFYAPFDSSFEPLIAKGNPVPIFGAMKPTFGKGVIGQAMIAGGKDETISYIVKDNMNDHCGTIAVWIKPLNWSSGDAQQHVYMQISGRMIFYHYWESGTTCLYWMNGSNVMWGIGNCYLGLKKDEWNHLVVTWNEKIVTLYFNGKYVAHNNDMPSDLPSWTEGSFSLADANWTAKGNNQTAFDELIICNRPLSPVEVKSLYRRGIRQIDPPQVHLSPCTAAPVVDGKITDQEWENVAGITGFVDRPFGNLTHRQIFANLTYDATNLYILIASEKSAIDVNNYAEVWLSTDTQSDPNSIFRFRITTTSEQEQFKGTDTMWQGAWAASCGSGEDTDLIEMAIPFATLDIDTTKAKNLRINIIRSWSGQYGDWASWADTTLDCVADRNANRLGVATLNGKAPVVSIKSLGQVYYAKLAIQGNLIHSETTSNPIKLTVRLQPTDLQEWIGPDHGLMVGERRWSGTIIKDDREITTKPECNILSINREFRDTNINSVLIRAEDAAGTVLYAQQVPFICTPPILVEAKTYPQQDRLDIVADIAEYREAPPAELSADMVLLDDKGQLHGNVSINQFSSERETVSYNLKNLPEGEITIKATLRKIGGSALAHTETQFHKIAPGPWLNNTLGLDDIVIPPFTPIQVEGTSVSVWNRTYVWQDSLLPVEIYTNGVQVLAAPIELYTSKIPTGKANAATITILKNTPTEAIVEAKGEIDGVPVISSSTIEYDGMISTDILFDPPQEMTLPSLKLLIPMKTELAFLYHHYGKGGAVAETENRRGPLNSDAEVPLQFWLGTGEQGLQFFPGVSGKNWGKGSGAHIKLEGPVTNYTVRISDQLYTVGQGIKISFGFIATPVKPMRDNWRFFRCGRDWGYVWTGKMTISNNDISLMQPGWPEFLKQAHQKIPLFVAYQRPDWINLATPEAAYYREEWIQSGWYISGSDTPAPGRDRHLSVCLGSEWQDFLLYHSMQITDDAGCDGFYYDGAEPIRCANTNHGHGFIDADGKLQACNTILDYRRYYKRLAIELHKRKQNWQDYLIWLHQSNHLNLPAYSFATMGWDGEQFSTAATSVRDYTKLMTPEYFLAEFHGKQFGYPVQWLGEFFDRSGEPPIGEKEMDTVLCLALVTGTHELTLAANWASGYGYLVQVIDRADEFGLSQGRAEFIGWWMNQNYIQQTPNDPKMKCSLWKADGKTLIMLGNANSGVDSMTTITLKLEALRLTGILSAMDWWTKEAVPIENNSFTIGVKGSNWRMIAVDSEQ